MQVTQEQHDAFANGLALILPPTPHKMGYGIDITPGVLANARAGAYADLGDGREPYAFYAHDYWLHLRPAILELWRAIYLAK